MRECRGLRRSHASASHGYVPALYGPHWEVRHGRSTTGGCSWPTNSGFISRRHREELRRDDALVRAPPRLHSRKRVDDARDAARSTHMVVEAPRSIGRERRGSSQPRRSPGPQIADSIAVVSFQQVSVHANLDRSPRARWSLARSPSAMSTAQRFTGTWPP